MTNQDYIRAGVELADEWAIAVNSAVTLPNGGDNWYVDWPTIYLNDWPDYGWQFVTDALAAQLVRQVDALEGESGVNCYASGAVEVFRDDIYDEDNDYGRCEDSDRTMNTIKAIVDSGVLDD